MRLTLFFLICSALLLPADGALSNVRLPRLVSDGMVLQRNTTVRIWGWGTPGEQVTIRFLGSEHIASCTVDGTWEILLAAMSAGGPYSMEIDAGNHIVINDILIGDVWVCSGQSNMELPIERVKPRYENLIAHAFYPQIRQFLVPHKYEFHGPQSDVAFGQWEGANPWSVLRFSATGFFFARSLWEKYHVPIGLINASYGGTPLESWLSKEALKEFPAALETAEQFKNASFVDSVQRSNVETSDSWSARAWPADRGFQETPHWSDPACDASSWPTIVLPGFWDEQGVQKMNGVVWFRKTFSVPASLTDRQALLLLGTIVDADYVYVNGVFVGSTAYQYPPRRYVIAPGVLKPGTNTIVVRAISYGGRGCFTKDKPYELRIGNHAIDLKGAWRYAVGTTAAPMPGTTTIAYQPEGCYNGMLAPLQKYTIKGFTWYQGESNCGRAEGYQQLLSALIRDWRAKWADSTLPFLTVQLPNFGPPSAQPAESGWAKLRFAQLKTLAIPHTGLAVTLDIGEWNDIHPLNKEDVGKRLALEAERVAYGEEKLVSSGPIVESMKIEGNAAVIAFRSAGAGLVARGGSTLKGFEVSGDGETFVRATARISGKTVVVTDMNVPHPVAVRYAWADNPEGANLYNKEGLPASTFEARK